MDPYTMVLANRLDLALIKPEVAAIETGAPAMTIDPTFVPGPETARAFRDALGRFATGVTIVTTRWQLEPVAFVATSFAAVSLEPPLVLWSPARASRRFAAFEAATYFVVHVLGVGQAGLVTRFATAGSGFDMPGVVENAEGIPLLPESLARFECQTHARYDGGDHLIMVGRVLRAQTGPGEPLIFATGGYGQFAALT
jgi:flavin reductase (DIM6/NTAB) family NADH-FMN oxidoreductase RutF